MVDKVNRAILQIVRLPLVSDVKRGYELLVCEATLDEWNQFAESENQALRSTYMEWIDGHAFIVEFGGYARGNMRCIVDFAFFDDPILRQYLFAIGGAYTEIPGLPLYEPTSSIKPSRKFREQQDIGLPEGVRCARDLITLKVEIGTTRGWGVAHGDSLDWKALHAWTRVPGVAYVLCIAVGEKLEFAEYKLYELQRVDVAPPFIKDPVTIQAPSTVVLFDSRRLLGLPPNAKLPPQFPDPVQMDLFAFVEQCARQIRD